MAIDWMSLTTYAKGYFSLEESRNRHPECPIGFVVFALWSAYVKARIGCIDAWRQRENDRRGRGKPINVQERLSEKQRLGKNRIMAHIQLRLRNQLEFDPTKRFVRFIEKPNKVAPEIVKQAAKELNCSENAIWYRLSHGWPPETAMSKPMRKTRTPIKMATRYRGKLLKFIPLAPDTITVEEIKKQLRSLASPEFFRHVYHTKRKERLERRRQLDNGQMPSEEDEIQKGVNIIFSKFKSEFKFKGKLRITGVYISRIEEPQKDL